MARDFSKAFYNSKQWQNTREYILKRDRYICKHCGQSSDLEVHHIIRLNANNMGDANITVCEDNLITLCRDCHFKEHEREKINASKKDDVFEGYYFDEMGMMQKV